MSTQETDDLLERVEAGDSDALGLLLQQHRDRLRRMVMLRMDQRLVHRLDASDIVQEGLTDAARKLPDYLQNRVIDFYPWLRRLTWERLIQAHRKHLHAQLRSVRREQVLTPGPNATSQARLVDRLMGNFTSPSNAAEKREEVARMQLAIETLAREDQELLLLRYVEQLSPQEAAQVLSIKPNTFSQRHLRLLTKLRRLMQRESDDSR